MSDRKLVFGIAIVAFLFGCYVHYVQASGMMSDPLTLAKANAAITASGWGAGKIFPDGENRYLVRRAQFVAKKGTVFVCELDIPALPKHE